MSQETLPSLESLKHHLSLTPPQMPFCLMDVNDQGQSTLLTQLLQGFKEQSVGGAAAPQWLLEWPGEVVGIKFAVLPVGWVGEWHESPQPQWVIPLSGRWFLETTDGQRLEMGPGNCTTARIRERPKNAVTVPGRSELNPACN